MIEWKRFGDEKPLVNVLMVIFQYKRRRYIISRFGLYLPSHNDYRFSVREKPLITPITHKEGNPTWFSECGNRLKPHDDDMWAYFQPVTITKVYE